MFSHFFIDRPIFASVLSIVLVILGVVSYQNLPVAQYPEIAPPTVNVTAIYPGANAQVVADVVATPIEQQINGVENMLYMTSSSGNNGQVSIDVTFALGTDLDFAQVLVQNRVAIAQAKLPPEVIRQGITVKKKSPSILLTINLYSPDQSRDALYLSNFARTRLYDALARVEGVGELTVAGEREYAMRVWLDPGAMASRNLSAGDVIQALQEQNVQVAAGALGDPPVPEGVEFRYTLSAKGRLLNAEEFERIVLKAEPGGRLTRLGDVARIQLGAKDSSQDNLLDGGDSVTLVVYQLPGSNALATAERIRQRMESLRTSPDGESLFPPGVEYAIHYDTTIFVKTSIEEVQHALRDAFILVFLVVLVFLQNWRATLIPMIAVPVSLVGTFAVMNGLGFSLNNLSLLSLVLAIGIVVDDAIVVVENVERNLKLGLSPREASRKAMKEISSALIAIALVLIAVFVPTAFMPGIPGQFYRQFALTIAASTAISAFNALTLSPALCRLLLKGHVHDEHGPPPRRDPLTLLIDLTLGWFFRLFNLGFQGFTAVYVALVRRVVRFSLILLIVYGGLMFMGARVFTSVPLGFIPEQDKGYCLLLVRLPEGASLSRTTEVMRRLDKIVRTNPAIDHTIGFSGLSVASNATIPNYGTLFVTFKPFEERAGMAEAKAIQLVAWIEEQLRDFEDAIVLVANAPPVEGLGTTGGLRMQVQDIGGVGFDQLQGSVETILDAARAEPRLQGLYTGFRNDQPQYFIEVDREKAKALQVPLNQVFGTLQTYLGSSYVNDFTYLNRNWQVKVQADAEFRIDPADVGRLKVRNAAGDMVPLGTLINLREIVGPSLVSHFNIYPAADVIARPAPGVSSGQAIGLMESIARANLPPGTMGFEWTEIAFQQVTAGNTLGFVFGLGTLFVFLVLAAQFESWSLPLSIVLIVPMCLVAGITGVALVGLDNNIFIQIGFVVLVGLAAKNAILIVEFVKQLQEQGLPRREAIVEGCRLRLRPILMTAFAFILGVVPLILGTGAGVEMRYPMGVAVFSGMLGVTLFGLFFTPVFYDVIVGFTEWVGRLRTPATPHQPTPTPSTDNATPVLATDSNDPAPTPAASSHASPAATDSADPPR